VLDELSVPYEVQVVSAHRTPDLMADYARTAETRGIEVIIAGAGGAAHLPGMTAAKTVLPVLGVPEQYLQYIIDMQMAIHRALEPEDLTGTAVWLASDDAKMVTGQVIPVDGGMVMLG
jgi:NAD(P)-dependent dehydrogenase (short-subunit alcohol dehydrogenase family)